VQFLVGAAILISLAQMLYVLCMSAPVLYSKIGWRGFIGIGLLILLCIIFPVLWRFVLVIGFLLMFIWINS